MISELEGKECLVEFKGISKLFDIHVKKVVTDSYFRPMYILDMTDVIYNWDHILQIGEKKPKHDR